MADMSPTMPCGISGDERTPTEGLHLDSDPLGCKSRAEALTSFRCIGSTTTTPTKLGEKVEAACFFTFLITNGDGTP